MASLPAIVLEIRKARAEYREASQKAWGLWVRLCNRSGVDPNKRDKIEGLVILQEDELNQECREAVLELNRKAARFRKLLVEYQRIRSNRNEKQSD